MSDAAGTHSVCGCAARVGSLRGHLTMTASADPAARVQELAAAITAHRAAYYAGAPKVSDFEYDRLEDELRALLAEHPDLARALRRLGMETPEMAHADTAADAVEAIRAIERRRGDSDADLDGAVIRL